MPVTPLPIWKRDATVVERLRELLHMAECEPEKFAQMVIVWRGVYPPDPKARYPHGYRFVTVGCNVHDTLALLRCGGDLASDWARNKGPG